MHWTCRKPAFSLLVLLSCLLLAGNNASPLSSSGTQALHAATIHLLDSGGGARGAGQISSFPLEVAVTIALLSNSREGGADWSGERTLLTLQLHKNLLLLSPAYSHKIVGEMVDGQAGGRETPPPNRSSSGSLENGDHCYYHGEVEGVPSR